LICHIFYLSQTLTTLFLRGNLIGDVGAQAIGQALQRNQVREIFSFFVLTNRLFYLSQTLTTLNLDENEIGDAGVQAIGHALERNKVR